MDARFCVCLRGRKLKERKLVKRLPPRNHGESSILRRISHPFHGRVENFAAPADELSHDAETAKLARFDEMSPRLRTDGIRHHYGIAKYMKEIDVPAEPPSIGVRACLEFEKIAEVAEIIINGKTVGGLWKPTTGPT